MRKNFTLSFGKAISLMIVLILVISLTIKAQGVKNISHPANSPYTTIQAAIDDPITVAGDIITVAPGLYDQDEANGRDPNTGGSGANDFNIFINKSITLQGVDGAGTPITDANSTLAIITPKRLVPTFGTSVIFVQADNVVIRGIKIQTKNLSVFADKTLEDAGDNLTVEKMYFDLVGGDAGIYVGDFHFDNINNLAHLKSYNFNNNIFRGDQNESGLYIANGAGWPNNIGTRLIQNNVFDQLDDALDFAGPVSNVGWLLYPVGTATISGNTFSGIARRHLEVWGDVSGSPGYTEPDWCSIISGNTFDKGSFTWQGLTNCPTGAPRRWTSGDFHFIAGIYSKIQPYAINKAQSGDLVEVMPGTYVEQLVIDSKNLTITGAGAATTIIQAPAVLINDPDGAKTIVLFTGAITAAFSGFTVQGPVNGLNFGIYVRAGATVNIHNNTIKDIRDNPLSGNQYGYGIEIGKYNNTFPNVDQIGHATITNNIVSGYQKTGIECEGASSSATITGNTVTGAGLISTTSQNGIQIRRGATGSINTNTVTGNAYTGHDVNATGISVTYPGNDVIIQGNIVNHNTANIYTYEAHGVQILDNQVRDAADGRVMAGITADADFNATATVGIAVTITGNSVKNNFSGGSHQGPGIFLWGVNSGTVSGNDIVGNGDDGILIGSSGNIAITNNLFSENGYDPYPGGANPPYSLIVGPDPNAAAIDFGGFIPELEFFGAQPNLLGGFSVHNNSFVGNRNGIWNYDVASVDAECNWWGSITGPTHTSNPGGTGDIVSDNVDFTPWLINGTDTDPATGFQPIPNSCEGGIPKLSTSINDVVLNANNDGIDDNGSFAACNTTNNILFNSFTDQNGLSDPLLKVYQTYSTSNVTVPFCNNCWATMAAFAGATGSAALINPSLPGTLTISFRSWVDANNDGNVDESELKSDWIVYTITINPLMTIAECSYSDATCNGTSTGSVTAGTVSNAVGTPNYSWKNASNTVVGTVATVNNLPAGTYTLTVTDNCSSQTCTVTIGEPSLVAAPAINITQPTCSVPTGKITVITPVPGTGISYMLTGTNPVLAPVTNSTGVFPGLAQGAYSVITTNGAGCTSLATSATINPPTATTLSINCPPAVTVNANTNKCYATNVTLGTPTTAGCGTLTVTNNAPSQFPVGTTLVTWKVKNTSHNASTCTQTVTVIESIAPVITKCASPKSANANSNCQAAVPDFTEYVTATDNCTSSRQLVITQSPVAGTMVPKGVTTITITVKDASGNSITCSTTFTVSDNTPPSITKCATPQTANANNNCQAAVPNFTGSVTGTESCSLPVVITQAPAAGTLVSSGVTTVTITLKDASGNSKTCTTTFTVKDNTPPVIVCPGNITVNAGKNCSIGVTIPKPAISDNCGVTKLTWVMTGATKSSSSSNGINYVGTRTFNADVTTITYTAKDAANNSTSCSFTVTVICTNTNCNNSGSNSVTTSSAAKNIEVTGSMNIITSPNPSQTYFNLKVMNTSQDPELLGSKGQVVMIKVFDISGKLVQQLKGVAEQTFRFGESVIPGTYVVEVYQGLQRATLKVVKQ